MPFIGESNIRQGSSAAGGADLGDAIANSIRFNDDDSAYLTFTPATSPTDSRKTWTVSVWLKRCTLGTNQYIFSAQNAANNNLFRCYFDTSDKLHIYSETSGGATGKTYVSTQVFRDPHSWGHLVVNWDTSQATAGDRLRVYWNGTEITSWATAEDRGLNDEVTWNATEAHLIGARKGPADFADMYLAKFEHFANQRLAATSFGRFSTTHTNVWVPIETTASFGTNDVDLQLLFATAPGTGAGAGDDTSGNANDWTESGLAANDQSSDTPTNNFPTLSPIDKNSAATLSDGNLRYSSSSSTYHGARSTFWIDDTTPKIYWEATYVSGGGSSTDPIGLADYEYLLGQLPVVNGTAVFYTHTKGSTASFANETATPHSNVSYDADTGDVLRFAYDPATKKLWVGNVTNGTYLGGGDPATDSTPTATLTIEHPCSPVVGRFGTLGTTTYDFNFGQTAFTGTVPTGFVALNSANLPNVVTDLGGTDKPYESVQLITASGDNIVSDLDAALASGSFLKIYKNITTGSTAWKWVFPDDTGNMWDSSVNTGKTTYSAPSGSDTFAGIGIKIATSVGTASSEVSHTSGSSTNYAHGLGVTPAFVILFPNLTANKRVFHSALDSGKLIRLDNQQAQATDSSFTVDATNVTISSSLATGDYRILAFAEIDGFSSFEFHDSNSSADGPFLYHGFSPLFEITIDIDLQDTALDWDLFSYKLESHSGNVLDQKISLNEQDAKAASGASGVIDHVSTGSKTRTSSSEYNTSSRHHARVAFAQAAIGGGIPFPNAR